MKTDFENIAAVEPDAMPPAQFKLTYHGPQTKPVPTTVLVTHGHKLDMDAFTAFQAPGLDYGNDVIGYLETVDVTADEMHRVLAAALAMPRLSEQQRADTVVSCSVVLIQKPENEGAFLLFDRPQIKAAVAAMVGALDDGNETGKQTLTRWGAML